MTSNSVAIATVATAAARMTGKMRKSWITEGSSKKRVKEVFVNEELWTLASFQRNIDRFQPYFLPISVETTKDSRSFPRAFYSRICIGVNARR